MTEDPWLTEDERAAWQTFYRLQSRLLTRIGQHLQRESGLSMADYEVLVHLTAAPEGYLRAYALGEATQWEKSRLSHHLTRMVARGLVRRETCAEDSRYANIVLTKEGRAAIEAATPQHVAHVRSWFIEALTADQLDALTGACRTALTRLDQHPDPVDPGACPMSEAAQPTTGYAPEQ